MSLIVYIPHHWTFGVTNLLLMKEHTERCGCYIQNFQSVLATIRSACLYPETIRWKNYVRLLSLAFVECEQ